MFKRLLTFFLIFSLTFAGGCRFRPSPAPNTIEKADPHRYLSEYHDKWQYTSLSNKDKRNYGSLYAAVKKAESQDSTITFTDEQGNKQTLPGVRVSFVDDTAITKEQIAAILEAFLRDNPHLFYIKRTYHLIGQITNAVTPTYTGLLLEFSLPLQERLVAIEQLRRISDALLVSRPNTTDEYETELYLHDELAKRCTYNQEAANNHIEAPHNAYTAYGALVEGSAVCEGYAKAMQLLLSKAGISSTVVSGTALKTGENHMWNLVSINHQNYYLDPTWNDSNQYQQHAYFNLTSEMLSASHTLDTNQPSFGICTATEDNYFTRNNTYIDTYDRDIIAQTIAEQIQKGNTIIQLKFASEKFTNGQLFLKNRMLTTQKVNAHLPDASHLLNEYQLWADEKQFVLTLIKQ